MNKMRLATLLVDKRSGFGTGLKCHRQTRALEMDSLVDPAWSKRYRMVRVDRDAGEETTLQGA